MKNCRKCGEVKLISDFWTSTKYSRNHEKRYTYHWYCKSCVNKSHKIWTDKNKEKLKIMYSKAKKKFRLKYPEKARAHLHLYRAVKSGKVIKKVCEVCGDPKSEGHHHDYSKPLDVSWLCRKHHILAYQKTNV